MSKLETLIHNIYTLATGLPLPYLEQDNIPQLKKNLYQLLNYMGISVKDTNLGLITSKMYREKALELIKDPQAYYKVTYTITYLLAGLISSAAPFISKDKDNMSLEYVTYYIGNLLVFVKVLEHSQKITIKNEEINEEVGEDTGENKTS